MSATSSKRAWLQNLVGEWSYQFHTADDSDHSGVAANGTESVRALSDHFIILDNTGQSSDGSQTRAATLIGYEPNTGRFAGAVAGSALDRLFVYDGDLSPDGRALLLETEGPAMSEGRETDRYRDVFQIIDDDHRFTAAEVLQDGEWKEFMRSDFVRVR
ncbi:DUF1579 domain-containing protein [Gloeobacter kilaueensis]|uniref:DUF1579 domain-containing protein n=1 Tax=Gloeobacter kilaueensis (strain ATCC BAA-2537 / CCAP 1431/1 / ULC 316 / JS1) TaxID=1183438 RepID=U5QSH2_GLOK1|nr:DUF1579 domain-containing protein [Gloeobacter kilaueensis]AGY60685.1 hypothetical protein GKIL_4439 [Gloeobacter kilaueensis JS1]